MAAAFKLVASRMKLVDENGFATPEFFRVLHAMQERTGGISGILNASDVASSPTGDVAATNVQAAIAELASEKATQAALNAVAAAKENVGTAAASMTAHLAAVDPHPQYLTAAEGSAAFQPLDADLTSWAGVTRAAGFDTFAAGAALPVANGGTGDTGTAWTAYTPTVTPFGGAITAYTATGRYKQIGKTVFISIVATITTNGTGSGALFVSIPAGMTSAASQVLGGRENNTSGLALTATIGAAGTNLFVVTYANAYPAGSGSIVAVGGVLEIA